VHSTLSTITADTGLTPDEITRASRHLSVTRGFLLESISGLSGPQWDFKSAEDLWSIAENLEHIVLIECAVHGIIERLSNGPEAPGPDSRNEMDELILREVPKRSHKLKAPPTAVPTGRWSGPEGLQRFVDCRGKTEQLLVTRRLRGPVHPHPLFGPWDGYQWLLAAGSHGARHTAQIREVKDHPNFPH
jgi:hypothetical protein